MYSKMGDYNRALEYYHMAYDIRKKILGQDHPDTATILNNIGILYYRMCNYLSAERYLQEAYDSFKKSLGSDHPNTKNTLNSLETVKKNIPK